MLTDVSIIINLYWFKLKKYRHKPWIYANAIALAAQVGLLLLYISAVAVCLLAIGTLECIRAMPIMRRESAGTLH